MDEAPTPIFRETKPEKEATIENMKKFEVIFKENIKYEISIFKKGINLIIQTEIVKGLQKIKYSNSYDLDSLKKDNKFWLLCDTIDDVIDTIYQNAQNFSGRIYEINNDYEIKIPVPIKNIKEISFTLKERKKTPNEILNDIITNSSLQKKKIEEQDKKLDEQNQKIEELRKKLEAQEKYNEELNGKIKIQNEKLEEKIKLLEAQIKKIEEHDTKIEEQRRLYTEQNKLPYWKYFGRTLFFQNKRGGSKLNNKILSNLIKENNQNSN